MALEALQEVTEAETRAKERCEAAAAQAKLQLQQAQKQARLTVEQARQQADRIWMDGEPDPLPALTQAGITDPQDRLGEITASLEESSAQLRAVLAEGAA